MRNLFLILLSVFSFSAAAQHDTCDCGKVIPYAGLNSDDPLFKKVGETNPYTGTCLLYEDNFLYERKEFSEGHLLTVIAWTSAGDTQYYSSHVRRDTIISTEFTYSAKKRDTEIMIIKKGDQRWVETIRFSAISGNILERDMMNEDIQEHFNQKWNENGVLCYEYYYSAPKNRSWFKMWYDNGNPNFEKYTRNNLPDSVERKWFENGKLQSQKYYHNGVLNGTFITYYQNGKPQHESTFKDSIRHGVSRMWYSNGKQAYDRTYYNDVRTGKWIDWDTSGHVTFERTYVRGKPLYFIVPDKPESISNCKKRESLYSACDSIINAFRPDAIMLALQAMQDPNNDYYDSVIVPEKFINKILLELIIMYNHGYLTTHNYYDAKNSPGARCADEYKRLTIYYGHNDTDDPLWLDNWRAGNISTDNILLNKICSNYHLEFTFKGYNYNYNSTGFYCRSPYVINGAALSRELQKADSRLSASTLSCSKNESESISYDQKWDCTVIEITHGWDDCPAGCIHSRTNIYYLYDDGEVDFIKETKR